MRSKQEDEQISQTKTTDDDSIHDTIVVIGAIVVVIQERQEIRVYLKSLTGLQYMVKGKDGNTEG
jgi:hypothetical protein